MTTVFIASPYTLGDVGINVKKSMDIADDLMNIGFTPFVPLLFHFQHITHPRPYEDWIKLDLAWLSKCDCVLRLPGESSGADGEVAKAEELGIPVYYSIQEMLLKREHI
jgi:hypothetical protein